MFACPRQHLPVHSSCSTCIGAVCKLCTGLSRPGSCLQLYSGRLCAEREGGLHLCFLLRNKLHHNVQQDPDQQAYMEVCIATNIGVVEKQASDLFADA